MPTTYPNTAAARAVEWALAYPAEMAWLGDNMEANDFALSLAMAVDKFGHLTDGQLQAVRDNIQRAGMRAAAPVISVAEIEAKFAIARANQVKKPAMRLDTFVFKAAGDKSANAGGIYVTEKQGEESVYLGKVLGGKFLRVGACTDDQQARIIAAASDPTAAAIAYGQRTGNCSICGRELTAEGSIEIAVGPICLSNYGLK